MTLRENSSGGHEIPPNRKYSVSHSGRFKSRPKIRPSLSGDVFRPEPVNTGATRAEETQPKAQPTVQRTTIEQVDRIVCETDSENSRAQQMHQAHPHHHAGHSQKHHSARDILETSL